MPGMSFRWVCVLLGGLALGACHRDRAAATDRGLPDDRFVVRGGVGPAGEAVEFGVAGGRIVPVAEIPPSSTVIELGGRSVVPAFIDSHVHLSYYDVAAVLPRGGIVGAIDFAAPLASLELAYPIAVRRAGPMLTPLGGYPTQSWGAGGYGLELGSVEDASAAVDRLLDAGVDFVKAPLMGNLGLSDEMLGAVVTRAHERGVRVAVHAVSAADAQRAIASEIDILAHTPTEALPEAALLGFGERTVVSTLAAFGGAAAYDNLRALRSNGALVLYGTDLGNTREAGIQAREIEGLVAVGLSGSEIVRAATSDAAAFWGIGDLGSLEPGKRASFLVLDEDPAANPLTLAAAHTIVCDGRVVTGSWP